MIDLYFFHFEVFLTHFFWFVDFVLFFFLGSYTHVQRNNLAKQILEIHDEDVELAMLFKNVPYGGRKFFECFWIDKNDKKIILQKFCLFSNLNDEKKFKIDPEETDCPAECREANDARYEYGF